MSKQSKFIHTIYNSYKFITGISVLAITLLGCVNEFEPDIDYLEGLLVIDGHILKEDSIQKVVITRATSYSEPEFLPVSGCFVMVSDNYENEFIFQESVQEPGEYEVMIPEEYLSYNSEFQLYVKTPEGNEYLSEKETILESSEIDSIYYEIEDYQNENDYYDEGLQFYTDLKADEAATKNYMWTVTEVFEIHTFYGIDGYWFVGDKQMPLYNPIRDSISVCWQTDLYNQTYNASTTNLTVNEKKKIPLNYVPSSSTKLNEKYCLELRQYALSDAAYEYQSLNNIATTEGAGLYQTQPSQIKSNIVNINDPDEVVLGFFWAASYSLQRIFYDGPLTQVNSTHCELTDPILGWKETWLHYFQRINRDLYLVAGSFSPKDEKVVTFWQYPYNQVCIDCRADGGTIVKPEFWED